MKRFVSFAAFVFLTIILCPAEDWQLDLGAGVNYATDYPGAEDYGFSPIPVVEVRHVGTTADFFAGTLNGIGFDFTCGDSGFYSSLGVDLGESRDSDLVNHARCFCSGGWSWSFLSLDAEASYYPIVFGNRVFHGVILEPGVSASIPILGSLHVLTLTAGSSFMNGDYSSPWYGSREKYFGARSVFARTDLVWQGILPHTWIYASWSVERLLGKAADCAQTKRDLSQSVSIFVAYRFKKR